MSLSGEAELALRRSNKPRDSGIRGVPNCTRAMECQAPDARLSLAGEWITGAFRDACFGLPGWNRVCEHGVLERPELVRLLLRASCGLVLIQPLENYLRSQPTKIFEYMAAGLPILASDFPLWRSLFREYDCGLLVNPASVADIAAAMRWFVDHPEEAARMGRRGFEAVRTHYNWEQEYLIMERFYEDLLATWRPGG